MGEATTFLLVLSCLQPFLLSSAANNETPPRQPKGICLEKIANGSYLDMAAHPDGSNRVFLANIHGKIWLATVPEQGFGEEILIVDESSPFLDITDTVHVESELGLLSIAFHPKFAQNGRFFASYNCDNAKWFGCYGRCSCNTDVNCDPSKLSPRNGAKPCQYHSVVSEFTANGSSLSDPSLVIRANPTEVRRIFTMGLAYTTFHGGQILFGPDGYLYLTTGDNEARTDPYNFAQNKKSLLGKILRFDIDKIPSKCKRNKFERWGNYSVPNDNPYNDDKELLPEIWSIGLSNPWRCSFDSDRPSYFLCGDCGQDKYEEVNLITKGGNYGWRDYKGTTFADPANFTKEENRTISTEKYIPPVMGYAHSSVNANEGSAAITGGYFYRSKTDPCMYGRYLYADLYGSGMWIGTETPINSGNFSTSEISFGCAYDSALQCNFAEESPLPSVGYLFSMGTDNKNDVFLLTNNGILRIVRPSRCNHTCSLENITDSRNSYLMHPSCNSGRIPQTKLLILFPSLGLLLFFMIVIL
ncbi:HIPL1 protein-like [Papaver somniferum]|uniref:HIPL1 protein-like n=1 Tax=Papaver somniferum TaxID=3469 RepID=UPI000E6FB58C|nr:HIPL1 protein-like [Papaver somniferum]